MNRFVCIWLGILKYFIRDFDPFRALRFNNNLLKVEEPGEPTDILWKNLGRRELS